MAFSLMTRNNPLRIMDLPLEVHLRIQNFLLADLDTTLNQLRPLRLVSKSFDSIYAPVVVSHMVLFPSKLSYSALITYLRYLVHGLQSTSSPQSLRPFSSYCTTLTIKDWYFSTTPCDRRSLIPRKPSTKITEQPAFLIGLMIFALFVWLISGVIVFVLRSGVNGMAASVAGDFVSLITLYLPFFFSVFPIIWVILLIMERIPRSFKFVFYVYRLRHYIALLRKRLELPNVRCVRLSIDSRESDWSISCSTRLLLSLPKLTELDLTISPGIDLTYLTNCLAHLNKLHKLSLLRTAQGTLFLSHTVSLGTALIAQNEHLTHFEYDWIPDVPYDLSLLFRDVPTSKPLRLLHVSLNATCINFEALVPHIQSLTSFQFHYGKNTWCTTFSRAKVFPTTIKVGRIDAQLILFIRNHPGIVNLSVSTDLSHLTPPRLEEIPMFNVLCPHVQSLDRLCLDTKLLARMLSNMEFEMDLLRCTANLRELSLLNGETISYDWHGNTSTFHATYANNEQQIFRVIAILNSSLTVVIASKYKELFSWSLSFCQASTNPFIRDLARRLVYEKRSS